MNLKQLYNNIFSYAPPVNYQFNISENERSQTDSNSNQTQQEEVNIFPSLTVNMEYMITKYNLLINSDIILREFTINARGKQYNAFIVYIDGMVNSEIMDKFILEPLMIRNKNNLFDGTQSKVVSEAISNNISVKKVKKFDLSNYLMGCLMPQNSIKEISTFKEACSGINSRKLCAFCRYFKSCI